MDTQTWTFSQTFTTDFQAMRSDLESRIESAKSEGSIPQKTMQELTILLSKATKSLGDATGSIPSYDQKQYELQLKGIEKAIESLRSSSSSKGKFSFKRKAAAASSDGPFVPEIVSTSIPAVIPTTTSNSSILTLANRDGEYITRSTLPEHGQQTDLSISDLKNCIINLVAEDDEATPSLAGQLQLSALHVRNMSDCVVVLPSIEGSALLHDVVNCVLILGCHQFRMHTSAKVDIFLSIGSNPVIEDCNNIRFTTYPSALKGSSSGAADTLPVIQDFSHIRSTPSPHFSIMEPSIKESIESSIASLRRGATSESLKELATILPREAACV